MTPLMVRSQNSDRLTDKVMEPEQFTQVIEAILSGKYSWACVLILRFAGYNPLHYIPYRTYNRLVKENAHCRKRDRCPDEKPLPTHEITEQKKVPSQSCQIKDLAFLETASEHQTDVHGGFLKHWSTNRAWRCSFLKPILTRR